VKDWQTCNYIKLHKNGRCGVYIIFLVDFLASTQATYCINNPEQKRTGFSISIFKNHP